MTRPRKLLWAAPFVEVPANPRGYRVTPTAEEIAAIPGPGGVICVAMIYREGSQGGTDLVQSPLSLPPERQEYPGGIQQLASVPTPGKPYNTRILGHAYFMPFTQGMFDELKSIGSVGVVINTFYDFTGGYAFHYDGDPSEVAADIVAQQLPNGAKFGGGPLIGPTTVLQGGTNALHIIHLANIGQGGTIQIKRIDDGSVVASSDTNQLFYFTESEYSEENARRNKLDDYTNSGYLLGWGVTWTFRPWPQPLAIPDPPEEIGKTDCKIKVFDILASLYVSTLRYTYAQVTNGKADGSGKIDDFVIGASFIDGTDLESVVSDICYIYNIQRQFTANGLRLYRNNDDLDNLTIAATIDESELGVTDTSSDGVRFAISTNYNDSANVVTQLAMNFIDADNDYKTNQIATKRPDALQTDQIRQVTLPFVMRVSDAEKLVNRLLVKGRLSLITHTFRLPPKYLFLNKGDIIELNHGPFNDIVRLVNVDLNGDKSQSVTAETVATGKRQVPAVDYPSVRTQTPQSVVGSVGIVFDIPALRVEDTGGDAADMFEVYYALFPKEKGEWQGGYFARQLEDTPYETLFHVYAQPGRLGDVMWSGRALNMLPPKKWVTDSTPLYIGSTPFEWDEANNTTREELRKNPNKNLAIYGGPGRWEIIQFAKIENNVMTDILRGLRGSEIACFNHVVGDAVYVVNAGIVMSRLQEDYIGTTALNRAVSEGQQFRAAEQVAGQPFQGNSRRPWAPYGFGGMRGNNGDIIFAWSRRDRAGGGWGKEPAMSETALAFKVTVCDDLGTPIRTLAATDTTVIYTAAMQQTDGTSSETTFQLVISQIGDIGDGFANREMVNV